jgi:hypothetical protein
MGPASSSDEGRMAKTVRVFVLGLVVGLTGRPTTTFAQSESLSLRLVGVNEAKVPGDVLTRAQAEATRIYARIGVTLIWADSVAADSHFTVKIVMNPLGGKSVDRRAMGGTPGTRHTRGTLAYAYYSRVEKLAHGSGTDEAKILGPVIAHEVGHLLLPFDSHTMSGVMGYGWDRTQLESAKKSQLTFTGEQAIAIRQKAKMLVTPWTGK